MELRIHSIYQDAGQDAVYPTATHTNFVFW